MDAPDAPNALNPSGKAASLVAVNANLNTAVIPASIQESAVNHHFVNAIFKVLVLQISRNLIIIAIDVYSYLLA
jgi:hypothetical protein